MSKQAVISSGACGALLLVCLAGFLVVGGCESRTPVSPAAKDLDAARGDGKSGSASTKRDKPLPPAKPLFEGWEPPAFTLLLSGERHGYLEPCGCSMTQSGGVSRQADLVRQIEKKGWPIAGLDLGGTVKRHRRQSQIKFEKILAAYHDMHYRATALGAEELRFGPEYLLSQHNPDPSQPDATVSFLAANVVFFDSPELGTPQATNVFEVGGKKVGVTAILGQGISETALLKRNDADIKVQPPAEALPAALAQLKEQNSDLLVLLSHADLDESRKLAAAFPDFDLILSAGGPEDPDSKPQQVGKTMLVTVGHKGKYTGVVGFYPDAEPRLRFELVDLDNRRFGETERMRQHMREYQDRLKFEQLVATEPAIPHPSGATFVGAQKCGECHTKAYAKWKTTKHAHAYESLATGRKGQEKNWISRVYDAECLACHVTGWHPQEIIRYESGFVTPEFLPDEAAKAHAELLKGQQCENCHGPGSRHVSLDEQWAKDRNAVDMDEVVAARRDLKLTKEIAKDKVCYRCHDLDNSPNFEFDKYWEEVVHPWRD